MGHGHAHGHDHDHDHGPPRAADGSVPPGYARALWVALVANAAMAVVEISPGSCRAARAITASTVAARRASAERGPRGMAHR